MSILTPPAAGPPVDPRGVRFSAALTTAATAFAMAAASLHAAFGRCLGCELYAFIARFRTDRQGATA